MNKIKSFVEKFQMFITNLPKLEAVGADVTPPAYLTNPALCFVVPLRL